MGTLPRLGLGLLLTPCVVAAAAHALPGLALEPGLASAVAFAGATLFPILSLALLSTVEISLAIAASVAALSIAALLVSAWVQPSPNATIVVVDFGLVGVAWALGASLGRRVQHASHLFPACVVAASADLISVLSPEGPSHAIAESERALSVLAVWFPVPGSNAVAPALGVGDLLFMALIFGVARAHALPYPRTIALCAAGTALAGCAAAWFGVAVPALLPIAAAVLLGLPSIRRLRRSDRSAAVISMLLASSFALATIARSVLSRH